MQGFAVLVGRDTAFFQSDGLVANTADESRMIWFGPAIVEAPGEVRAITGSPRLHSCVSN